jgi:hypothetical protein
MRVVPKSGCRIQRTTASLRNVYCGPGHIQCIYSSAYSGLNIQLNASALQLEISRQFNVRYTAKLVPNTAHILQFTQCVLWPRLFTMHFQLHIFSLQYSTERICAANEDISTIQSALYCKLGAKYSAHPTIDAMCTVVPTIYKVLIAPHMYASIFDRTYLRS